MSAWRGWPSMLSDEEIEQKTSVSRFQPVITRGMLASLHKRFYSRGALTTCCGLIQWLASRQAIR